MFNKLNMIVTVVIPFHFSTALNDKMSKTDVSMVEKIIFLIYHKTSVLVPESGLTRQQTAVYVCVCVCKHVNID